MLKWLSLIWTITRGTIKKFSKDDPIVYAASIAFFTIFSMPPILLIIAIVAGTAFEKQVVKGELSSQISSLVGPESARALENILENAARTESGLFTKIIGIATIIFSATVVFNFIQKALNYIWGVKPKPKKGFIKFLKDRIISFSMVITLGFLLLVTLLIETGLQIFKRYLQTQLENVPFGLMEVINFIISLGIITLIFALIYKVLPDVTIRWKDVWIGALVTALLFNIGKEVIGLIIGTTDVATTYGAAGSIVAVLLWVFYSSIILLLGAEFTEVYTEEAGKLMSPKKHAVKVEQKEIERE